MLAGSSFEGYIKLVEREVGKIGTNSLETALDRDADLDYRLFECWPVCSISLQVEKLFEVSRLKPGRVGGCLPRQTGMIKFGHDCYIRKV